MAPPRAFREPSRNSTPTPRCNGRVRSPTLPPASRRSSRRPRRCGGSNGTTLPRRLAKKFGRSASKARNRPKSCARSKTPARKSRNHNEIGSPSPAADPAGGIIVRIRRRLARAGIGRNAGSRGGVAGCAGFGNGRAGERTGRKQHQRCANSNANSSRASMPNRFPVQASDSSFSVCTERARKSPPTRIAGPVRIQPGCSSGFSREARGSDCRPETGTTCGSRKFSFPRGRRLNRTPRSKRLLGCRTDICVRAPSSAC